MKLGKMESLVIYVVGSFAEEHGGEYGIIPRKELTIKAANLLCVHGEMQGNFNSFKSSLSRAITSLCEKGLLVGYFQQWAKYRGMEQPTDFAGVGERPLEFGDRRTWMKGTYPRPRLQYLALTMEGYNMLSSPEVNIWIL